jgi:hypothetical protein
LLFLSGRLRGQHKVVLLVHLADRILLVQLQKVLFFALLAELVKQEREEQL